MPRRRTFRRRTISVVYNVQRAAMGTVSILVRDLKAGGDARGGEALRLVDRCAGEQVIRKRAKARRPAAAQPDHRTGELPTNDVDGGRTIDVAVIHAAVDRQARVIDGRLPLVAPVTNIKFS